MSATKRSYEEITHRLIQILEEGTVPWHKPWNSGEPCQNLLSKKPYRGINPFLLNCQPYASAYWLTFRQAKSVGGYVRRGQTGSPIWFWKIYEKENGEGKLKQYPVLRRYTVFNVEQCDGLKDRIPSLEDPERQPFSPIEQAERIVAGMPLPPTIQHGGRQAFYQPLTDTVTMPDRELFAQAPDYYSTLFHELVHSTGHESRLARKGIDRGSATYGSPTYSREELVAEMGAAYLCGRAQIERATLENSAAYIQGWIAKLKGDAALAVKAAGAAQRASDFILGSPGHRKAESSLENVPTSDQAKP